MNVFDNLHPIFRGRRGAQRERKNSGLTQNLPLIRDTSAKLILIHQLLIVIGNPPIYFASTNIPGKFEILAKEIPQSVEPS